MGKVGVAERVAEGVAEGGRRAIRNSKDGVGRLTRESTAVSPDDRDSDKGRLHA